MGRAKHGTVKLTRHLSGESTNLATWFATFNKAGQAASQGTIRVYDLSGKRLCHWTLQDVIPTKWTGPTFTADGNGLAKESLELAHHGFALEKD